MKKNIKNANYDIWFVLVLIAISILLFFLNVNTPMLVDDCGYALVNNIKDIVESQSQQYFTTNGRVISHGVVSFLGGIAGKDIFNVLNSIMFSVLICFLYRHSKTDDNGNQKKAILLLFAIFFFCWFLFPDQYVTMFMISGSLNYVWATVLVLGYILLFTKHIVSDPQHSVVKNILFFCTSLLTGAFVELYSVPVFPALIVWMLVNRLKFNKTVIISLLGFLLGLLFVVLAPGNFVRMQSTGNDVGLIKMGVNFMFLLLTNKIGLGLLLLTILFFVVSRRKKIPALSLFKDNAIYISSIIFSLGFIFLSGAWWSRTFFAVIVFSVILFFRLLQSFCFNKNIIYTTTGIMLILFVYSYQQECRNIKENHKTYKQLHLQLQGDSECIIYKENDFKKSKMTFDDNVFSMDKNNWKNTFFAQYYGKESVTILPKNLYDSLYLQPYYLEKQFEIFENCYTTSTLNYYIVPVENSITQIDTVKLDYSGTTLFVLRAKLAYLLEDTFLKSLVFSTPDNVTRMKKYLYTEMPMESILYYNNDHETFYLVSLNEERYLLIKKQKEYKEKVLSSVSYN